MPPNLNISIKQIFATTKKTQLIHSNRCVLLHWVITTADLSRWPKESECRGVYFRHNEINSFIADAFKSSLVNLCKSGAKEHFMILMVSGVQ